MSVLWLAAAVAIAAALVPSVSASNTSESRRVERRDQGVGQAHIATGGRHTGDGSAVEGRSVAASSPWSLLVTRSPANRATVSGNITWRVDVIGATPKRIDFAVDGVVKWSQTASPYLYGGADGTLDTTKLTNGTHTLTATAYGSRRSRWARSRVSVEVANSPTAPLSPNPPTSPTAPVSPNEPISPSAPDSPSAPTSPDQQPLLFGDDFNGAAGNAPDPTKWVAINWCDRWGSLSCNTNRPQNVSLDGGGNLRIRAIREGWTDVDGNTGSWTTGRLETQRNFSFTYGTLKARIKVPAGRGLWPSFWTNARAGWPATGEIDVMELLGHDPEVAYCSIHGAGSGGEHLTTTLAYRSPVSLAADFHVYEARWTPAQVDFYVDGTRCGTISLTDVQQFSPQQILVGMAVGGPWPGNPDSTTPSSGDMLVDWVRVYAP